VRQLVNKVFNEFYIYKIVKTDSQKSMRVKKDLI